MPGSPAQYRDDFHLEFYDPVSIALIRSLCRYRKVSIVIGSSWLSNSIWKFVARQFDLPIIDATSVAASGKQGKIEDWLMNHPSVKNFAILDGSGQNFSSDQNKRLIAVDNKEEVIAYITTTFVS